MSGVVPYMAIDEDVSLLSSEPQRESVDRTELTNIKKDPSAMEPCEAGAGKRTMSPSNVFRYFSRQTFTRLYA